MKAEKKFVALSQASLDKVFTWSEANEDDPMAGAYLGACMAVGAFKLEKILDRLKKSRPRSKNSWWWFTLSYELRLNAFKHRDILGRAILDMLKREEADKSKNAP